MSKPITAGLRLIADSLWTRSKENLQEALKLMDADQSIRVDDEHVIEGRLNFLNDRAIKIGEIAASVFGMETLESRKMDNLDFHELPVWEIKKALEQAFMAGRRSVK